VNTAWLGLGSNVDADSNIRSAIACLRGDFDDLSLSPVYASTAVGFDGEDFINLVARVQTRLSPLQLRLYLRKLEDRFDRRRDLPKFSDRTLDIDILLYDDLVLHSPLLDIPRAEILSFAHVLKPLADLDPDLLHPTEKRPLSEIWQTSGLDESCLQPLPDFH